MLGVRRALNGSSLRCRATVRRKHPRNTAPRTRSSAQDLPSLSTLSDCLATEGAHELASADTMTPLEKQGSSLQFLDLPTELIEKIYVYSGNIQFPFINRFLYRLLSQEVVRLALCRYAFSRGFTDGHPYQSPSFSARSVHDKDLIILQQRLLEQSWFTPSFAQRVEAITPELQARSKNRKEEDKDFRPSLPAFPWPPHARFMTVIRLMESIIVRMLRSLFRGWTKENVEMFHRLRDWNVEPDIRSINLSMSQE